MTPSSLPTVGPTEVGDDLLLDVRENDEWDAGHAPQALHVPLHELPARLPELQERLALSPGSGRVSVVCRVGGRSAQATAFLLGQGLEARNVDGGMKRWEQVGLPVVADNGSPRVL